MFIQLDFNLNFHVMCTDALQLWARYNAVKVGQRYLQQTLPDPTGTRRLTTNEWYLIWPVQTKYQGSRPGPQWIITTIFVVGDWRSIRTTTALGCTSMMYEKRLCHLPDIRCDPVSNVRYTWEWIDTTWCVLMLWNHGLSTVPINSYNWYKITRGVTMCRCSNRTMWFMVLSSVNQFDYFWDWWAKIDQGNYCLGLYIVDVWEKISLIIWTSGVTIAVFVACRVLLSVGAATLVVRKGSWLISMRSLSIGLFPGPFWDRRLLKGSPGVHVMNHDGQGGESFK